MNEGIFDARQAKSALGQIIRKYGPAVNGIKLGYVYMDGAKKPK